MKFKTFLTVHTRKNKRFLNAGSDSENDDQSFMRRPHIENSKEETP